MMNKSMRKEVTKMMIRKMMKNRWMKRMKKSKRSFKSKTTWKERRFPMMSKRMMKANKWMNNRVKA